MSKNTTVSFKSKSLQKPHPKDLYFPAIEFKANVNFPFKKNLKFKSPQPSQDNLHTQQIFTQTLRNNPQITFPINNSPQQTNSTTMFKNMARKQSMDRKASSTSKDWLNNSNMSAIYFTKRQLQMFKQKSIELQEQKSKLGQRFIQKKQSFQSFKKMKQMLKDQEKRALLDDLQFKRQQREREQSIKQKQQKSEVQFLHEQNLSKIEMQRCLKFRNRQQELTLSRQKYSQTEDNSHFLKMEEFKAKKDHMHLLESRLVFLMNEKIKNSQNEDYLDERMTSRSLLRDNFSESRRSKDISERI